MISNFLKITMATQRIKSLQGHYKRYIKEGHPNMKLYMTDDVGLWYALFHGLDSSRSNKDNDFPDGEYLVKIKAPAKYPYGPPEFYFLTHNGVYEIEKKVCIDIGSYHSNNYPAHIGMDGFAKMLLNGLINHHELGHGINLLKTTHDKKVEYAKKSKAYNEKHYADILNEINNIVIEKPDEDNKIVDTEKVQTKKPVRIRRKK